VQGVRLVWMLASEPMAGIEWLRSEYESRKREAETHVVEWLPYSEEIFDPRPFYFESRRRRPGRRVSLDATFPVARYHYGLGEDGRIWVERQATEFPGMLYETFFVYGPDGPIEAAGFDYYTDKRPIYLDRFLYANGLLVGYEKQGRQACGRSTYVYADGRPTRIEHQTGPSLDQLVPFQIEDVRFDETGKLAEIVCRQLDPTGREVGGEVRFKSKPRAMTAKAIEIAFLDDLVAAVPTALATLHVTRSVYCLALAYDPEQFSTLPPTIAIGLVDQLGQPDSEPWNPAKMQQIDLARENFGGLHKFAELLDQRPLSASTLRFLMNEAAARLGKIDWTSTMPVTTDFVVYATDLELGDFIPNLRKVLSKDRFQQLWRSGSLPR
jgi:hypothetical protein